MNDERLRINDLWVLRETESKMETRSLSEVKAPVKEKQAILRITLLAGCQDH